MASDGGQSPKHPVVRYCAIWAAVFGALTATAKFATELPKLPLLSHQQGWMAYYLPDVDYFCFSQGLWRSPYTARGTNSWKFSGAAEGWKRPSWWLCAR
jgi:hypothetical protein